MNKVYVVMGGVGEYSNRIEWPVKAFFDERKAKRLVLNASRVANEIFVRIQQLRESEEEIEEEYRCAPLILERDSKEKELKKLDQCKRENLITDSGEYFFRRRRFQLEKEINNLGEEIDRRKTYQWKWLKRKAEALHRSNKYDPERANDDFSDCCEQATYYILKTDLEK